MVELLPEFWSPLTAKEPAADPTVRQGMVRRRRTVTDIATWIQCFATYVSILSTVHPHAVPELLAYLIFILRAIQNFRGVAWVTYGAAFRRQAFITGNHQWSKVNPSLYFICFSGVARTGTRCELCLSLSHITRECTLVGDTDPDISTCPTFTAQSPQHQGSSLRMKSPNVCRNWNAGRYHMFQCRYWHACMVCGGLNPAYACCDRALGTSTGPNTQPAIQLPIRLSRAVVLGRDLLTGAAACVKADGHTRTNQTK